MNAPTTKIHVVNLTIDGIAVAVPAGTTVYHAAQQAGIELPIFCYQDRMPPFGACRVCLVEVEKMSKLQASCTLQAAEGMVVKTQSKWAVEGREDILEFLLINHPLDCPICDRGGECPLQDNVFHHGPGLSRFFEEKRLFVKPWPLGPVLMLDRERCIACARCTRFSELISGDHALQFIERGYRTEVGTPDGGPARSKFIGNTIMLCPVGALTSHVYRFRARPWDNDANNSTCTLCPVGCSMILDSRDGEITRTRCQENKNVNDIWLCDKGWFGYEFVYHQDRLKHPLIRRGDRLEQTNWEEALSFIAHKVKEFRPKGKLAAWGGDPLTVEENYLFQKLMREGAGVHHVDHRIGMPIISVEEEGVPAGMEISIGDCEDLDFVALFGIDLTEEFPVIWLRLRQAINKGAKVLFFGHFAPEFSRYLSKVTLHAPGQELEILKQHLPQVASLAEGKKGAFFVGRQYLANAQRKPILEELVKLKREMPHLSLNVLEGRGNSLGARLAGMHPELRPLGRRSEHPGLNALQVAERASQDGWDFLYIAGSNPAAQLPSKLWKEMRSKLGCLVVQDVFLTETAQQADVVLPTLCFVEKAGSFINIEQRIQKLSPGKEIPDGVYGDAEIFALLAHRLDLSFFIDKEFQDALKMERLPFVRTEKLQILSHEIRMEMKEGTLGASFAPILFDHGVRMQHNSKLVQLTERPWVRLHPHEGIKRKIQDQEKVYLKTHQNTIKAEIKWDEEVALGTLVLPLGFEQLPVHELSANLLNGLGIEIEACHTSKGG